MYKYSINDLPNTFNDYFKKRSDIHGYKTRHVNDLNLTKNKKKTLFGPFCSNGWSHSVELF